MFSAPLFPVALDLSGRACVVIGAEGDAIAREKSETLAGSGAVVRRIFETREPTDAELRDAFFVLSTVRDTALSQRLSELAGRHRFLLWCADQPSYCSVSMMAVARAGDTQIAISTSGAAPSISKALRKGLQRAMDPSFERYVRTLAALREEVRRTMPGDSESASRIAIVRKAIRGFRIVASFTYPDWFSR